MFIKYTLLEDILLDAEQYTENPTKALRNKIFSMYLFKIITIPDMKTSRPISTICMKIQKISLRDNILLRKTSQMKSTLQLTLLVLQLCGQEYMQGRVESENQRGVVVSLCGGLLQGTLGAQDMHPDTLYSEEEGEWMLVMGGAGYRWKVGDEVRIRIKSHQLHNVYEGSQEGAPQMKDLIQLKANEAGLGPKNWWI